MTEFREAAKAVMADARTQELAAEKENAALKKLQAAAGIIKPQQAERLDWMYEQSAASLQKTDDQLMNMPVADGKSKDIEDVKKLEVQAGSLFLTSATKTSEDMLRKLREDPLFQIRRQEQAARESMMNNPLILARLKKKEEKAAKKRLKTLKKAAKKEKKAKKKAKKSETKTKGKSSSSSSSSDGSADAGQAKSRRTDIATDATSARRGKEKDLTSLGPGGDFVSKRDERANEIMVRRDAAMASRGAPRRMTEEEREAKFLEFKSDAKTHDRSKDTRIASAEAKEKLIDDAEKKMRTNGGAGFAQEMRQKAFADGENTVAERMKNQRARRQKGIIDSLEKD